MTTPSAIRKKRIEVALPLEAANAASAREHSICHGHPSTLHPLVGAATAGCDLRRTVRPDGGRPVCLYLALPEQRGPPPDRR